jgi:hypothetical protein
MNFGAGPRLTDRDYGVNSLELCKLSKGINFSIQKYTRQPGAIGEARF